MTEEQRQDPVSRERDIDNMNVPGGSAEPGDANTPKWKAERLFTHKLAWMLNNPLYRMVSNIDANPEKTAAWTGVKPGMNVLEMGCGPGYYTPAIARAISPGGKVTALDLQQEMLDIVEGKIKKQGLKNVSTVKGNAQTLPFDDQSFDFIWALYVLEEVADLERVAREMFRILRPGGTVAVAQVSFDFTKEQKAYMRYIMPRVGFTVEMEKDTFWNFKVLYRKPA